MFENEFNSNSINQGKLFKSQTNTRILKGKNRVLSGSNNNALKSSTRTIEPFTTSSSINDSKYGDTQVNALNIAQNNAMRDTINSVNSASKDAKNASATTSTIAKTFLNVDGQSSLKNKNIRTTDSVYGAVNNMGIFSKYDDQSQAMNDANNIVDSNINFTSDVSNNRDGMAYPLLGSGSQVALRGQNTSLLPDTQSKVGTYAGKNIYVNEPKPLDLSYVAFQNSVLSPTDASMQNDLKIATVEQCLRRAVDKAGSSDIASAYITNSGNTQNPSVGQCYVGTKNVQGTYAYTKEFVLENVFNKNGEQSSASSTDSSNGVKVTGFLFFGADGGLYNGSPDGKYTNLISNLPNDIKDNVDPLFGSTINSVTSSYGQNLGTSNTNNMLFDDSVVNNSNINGKSSATLNTVKSTIVPTYDCNWPWWVPNFARHDWDPLARTYCTNNTIQQTVPILSMSDLFTYIKNITTPQNADIIYKCGKKTFKIAKTNISMGASFPIDCSSIMSKYGPFTLTIADNGIITVTNLADNSIIWQTTEIMNQTVVQGKLGKIVLNAPRPDWVSASAQYSYSGNTSPGLLSDGVTQSILTPTTFISSPSGYCRLYLTVPDSSGTSMLQVQYSLYDVVADSDGYLIGNDPSSFAQYSINGLNSSNIGQLSYVDLNNNLLNYPKPTDGYPIDSTYYNMNDYKPSYASIGSVTTSVEDCQSRCSNTSMCAAYTFDSSNTAGSCSLYKADDLLPNGNRIYSPGSTTYIKNIKITDAMNSASCSKEITPIDSSIYNNFIPSGGMIDVPNMIPDMKCGLGVVIDQQMQNLQNKNNIAIAKGNIIKDQLSNVFSQQNKVTSNIKNNNSDGRHYIKESKNITKKIGDIKNNVFTSKAAETDSELLSINDNYRYILWGIITVLISIGTIKAFRVGTS
jgi:hypothetical protein